MPLTHKSAQRIFERVITRLRTVSSRTPGIMVGGFLLILLVGYLVVLLFNREPDFGRLPNFAKMQNVTAMKTAFYDYLQPIIAYHNLRIMSQRSQLLDVGKKIEQGDTLTARERQRIKAFAEQYNVAWDKHKLLDVYQELLLRVDIIPAPLALVQAAKESGWGRSRFAVEGNNLFGQWCYKPGCGFVPQNRHKGKKHEVARFDSVSTAVRRYIHNINTHPNYHVLRQIRSKMREKGSKIKALPLVAGLTHYSQRREAYVTEIQAMIRQYQQFSAKHSSL